MADWKGVAENVHFALTIAYKGGNKGCAVCAAA